MDGKHDRKKKNTATTKKWAERLKRKKRQDTEQSRPLLPTKCTSLGSEISFQKDKVNIAEMQPSSGIGRASAGLRARRTSSPARRTIPGMDLCVILCFQHQGPIRAVRTTKRSPRRLGAACADQAMCPPSAARRHSGRGSG